MQVMLSQGSNDKLLLSSSRNHRLMTITINGKELDIPQSSNVLDVLAQIKQEDYGGIAVAINDMVIPKSKWNKANIVSGDKLLLIKASQGG